ncbi:hypothetical protein [Streptomyces sp. NPDC019507]|uniref:hypothetical protein n=1 Tax=Streptomyces sp. NPDC019507 TaxID=3154689 RepID=UPI0033CED0A0
MACANPVRPPAKVQLEGEPPWHCALIADEDASAADMRAALHAATAYGLEPVPDDEHEAELLDDGRVRIWLRPTDADLDPFDNTIPDTYTLGAA